MILGKSPLSAIPIRGGTNSCHPTAAAMAITTRHSGHFLLRRWLESIRAFQSIQKVGGPEYLAVGLNLRTILVRSPRHLPLRLKAMSVFLEDPLVLFRFQAGKGSLAEVMHEAILGRHD